MYESDKVTEEGEWGMKKIQNKLFSVELQSVFTIYIYDLEGQGSQCIGLKTLLPSCAYCLGFLGASTS